MADLCCLIYKPRRPESETGGGEGGGIRELLVEVCGSS